MENNILSCSKPIIENIRPHRVKRNGLRVVVGAILFICTTVSLSDTEKSYRSELQSISKQISKISGNLNSNKSLLKGERQRLFEAEQKVNQVNKQIAKTEKEIAQSKNKLDQAQTKINQLEKDQNKNLEALAKLLFTQFTQAKPNHLKMMLNQENPYALGRLNHYYDYFSQAQSERVAELKVELRKISEAQAEYRQELEALDGKQQSLVNKQAELKTAKQRRSTQVAKLSTKIEKSEDKLNRLKQDRTRLSSLLKQIARQAKRLKELEAQKTKTPAEVAVRKAVKGGFLKQKGRLNYPVSAKTKYKFGQRIAESGLKSEGVFFDTVKPQNVKAIYRGRVLFADFLKGYGLLLIIDHGDDHISLYGHNEVVYKSVGDQVALGEVVAKTGTTGGLKNAGLYFEVRHLTQPVNPALWCG